MSVESHSENMAHIPASLDENEQQAPESPPTREVDRISDEVAEFKPGLKFYLAFSSLLVNALMISFDGTSVGVVLPYMSADLHGSAIESFWTGTSFLLSSAVFQPPIAAISEVFGRRQALLFSVTGFLVGIIISSAAPNFTVMLVGRTIQGVGGGGMVLISDVIVTDLVPMRQRGIYYGMVGGMWVVGMSLGPVVGGAFALDATWRWIFWLNIPFAVITLIIVPLFMRLKQIRGSLGNKIKRIDWFGNIIFIGAATSFLIPVTWGGVQYPWTSASTLVPLLVGIAGFAAFAVYEKYVPAEPTIPLSLFNNYGMFYSLFAGLINGGIVYGLLYYLPLYFEATKGYNPVLSGVAILPASLTIAPFSIVAGFIITKQGDTRPVTCFGWLASTIGLGVMVMMDVHTSIPAWLFMILCVGLGQGLLYTSLTLINQAAATDATMAFAIGMFIFFRLLGQCVGVAIGGSIFQNQIKERLSAISDLASHAMEYSKDASGLVQTIKDMPAGTTKNELVKAYAQSLQIVWAVYCALAGVALIGTLFLKKQDLNREHNTEQGLDTGEKKKSEIEVKA